MSSQEIQRRIEKLSPEQRERLLQRLAQRNAHLQVDRIQAREKEGELAPLSFAQERLWIIDQIEPGSPVYNLPSAALLAGDLDQQALAKSMDAIMRRHWILRSKIVADGQAFYQQPVPGVPDFFDFIDLSMLDDPTEEARKNIGQASRRTFDLTAGCLLRVVLMKLNDNEHLLLIVTHHIASDGWSTSVLFREIASLYSGYVRGDKPDLSEPVIQYSDYARWQRHHLTDHAIAPALAYWKACLKDAPDYFSFGRARDLQSNSAGHRKAFTLPASLSKALNRFADREGVTLFMLLLAAFNLLLYRYTGQRDILIGTPIANRDRTEVEGLIGVFVNNLVLRTQLDPHVSFNDLLAQIKETTLGAFDHSQVPFEKLVETLRPQRQLNRTPLFQVMFVLQNVPQSRLSLPGIELTPIEVDTGVARFDLTLTLEENPQGLRGWWEYNHALFCDEEINQVTCYFQCLLQAIVDKPSLRLQALPLVDENTSAGLATQFVGERRHLTETTLALLFQQQVQKTPDAIALEAPDAQGNKNVLTYRELDLRSGALAEQLHRLGVIPERVVGVYLDRSLELIIALLGILKAGGVYLPLDPDTPRTRLSEIIEDASPNVIITHTLLSARLATGDYDLCDIAEMERRESNEIKVKGATIHPDNLAYRIYTSGSTGRPKGVDVSHRAATNHMAWMLRVFPMRADDRILLKTAIGFDASIWELILPLVAGATLVISKPGVQRDPEQLSLAIKEQFITQVQLVPSMLSALLDTPHWDQVQHLRRVFCGGEVLSHTLQTHFFEHSNAELINLYGPTETTIDASAWRCQPECETVSIGEHAIDNSNIYLLDESGHPVPAGIPGELYIGGAALSRGYHDRPGLTAERFVPDPYGTPGTRMYRTGDRARATTEGTIEFLGRLDGQLKLRGVRVEPGEMAARLRQHPAVRDAIIKHVVISDKQARLVAYVTLGEGEDLSYEDMRYFLRASLPEGWIPTALMVLETFPRTVNGKIDLQALPVPAFESETTQQPVGAVETQLAQIWSELLGVDVVGRHDDFFALGGHSLMVAKLIARIREVWHVDLSFRTPFEVPTLVELSRCILNAASELDETVISPADRSQAIPLSFAQARLWFLERWQEGDGVYNIPSVIRLKGKLDCTALATVVAELEARHEALRTRIHEDDGQLTQHIVAVSGGPFSHETLAEGEEVQAWLRRQAQTPFDLEHGPLWRVCVLAVAPDEHLLVIVVHHLIADGASMVLLEQELQSGYSAVHQGQTPTWSSLPIQYGDYAVWQRHYLNDARCAQLLEYWQSALGDGEGVSPQTHKPRPAVQRFQGAIQRRTLPLSLRDQLQARARATRTTLFMVLLSGFGLWLQRYSGCDDLLVGTPVANRDRRELEGVVGLFVNTLVMRLDLSGNPSVSTLLARVREQALGAYAHQALPFEQLVEALQPERDLSRPPLIQSMFSVQQRRETLELPGLQVQPEAIDNGSAKFDVSFLVEEGDQHFSVVAEYATDLYEADQVGQWLLHYQWLLEAMVAAPEQRIASLSLLSPDESQRLLKRWATSPNAHVSPSRCLHQAFQVQATQHAEAEAVSCGEVRISYGELERRSNQLAHYLRQHGVSRETIVGVLLERSIDLITALLAILKAGGVYLPLDPQAPLARQQQMLDDAQAHLVITHGALGSGLSSPSSLHLGHEAQAIAACSSQALEVTVIPAQLAYVLYTSGSTGQPKGVLISHGAVAAFLHGAHERFNLTPNDVVLAQTPLTFDIAVLELFLPLLHGARVELLPSAAAQDGRLLAERLSSGSITLMQGTPSTWQLLLAAEWSGHCPQIISGGEALSGELAAALQARGERVWNCYGPTEATVWCSAHRLATGKKYDAGISLGSPFTGCRLYILDAYLQPVPDGVAGELYIGGAGLARGYLGQAGLTASRFVPDPYGPPGARLYRSGDRVRYQNGALVYLGRDDQQMKWRGVRIEAGEIEACLLRQPGVAAALVRVRKAQLVAYLVAEGKTVLSHSAIRESVAAQLPVALQPTAYVILEAFPLTRHGKVDGDALPAPQQNATRGSEAPRTELEAVLAGLWCEVLEVENIGREENFFHAGGNSLAATRLITRIRRLFNVELPLRVLFETPTIEAIAQRLELLTWQQAHNESGAKDREVFTL